MGAKGVPSRAQACTSVDSLECLASLCTRFSWRRNCFPSVRRTSTEGDRLATEHGKLRQKMKQRKAEEDTKAATSNCNFTSGSVCSPSLSVLVAILLVVAQAQSPTTLRIIVIPYE